MNVCAIKYASDKHKTGYDTSNYSVEYRKSFLLTFIVKQIFCDQFIMFYIYWVAYLLANHVNHLCQLVLDKHP